MQSLTSTSHPLSNLEVPVSTEEFKTVNEAIKFYASRECGWPHCAPEDKEHFDVLLAKITLLQALSNNSKIYESSIIENVYRQLKEIQKREDSKNIQDQDLNADCTDSLESALEYLEQIVFYDPTLCDETGRPL